MTREVSMLGSAVCSLDWGIRGSSVRLDMMSMSSQSAAGFVPAQHVSAVVAADQLKRLICDLMTKHWQMLSVRARELGVDTIAVDYDGIEVNYQTEEASDE